MKELLTLVSLVLSGAVAEGPYPPSGWRPDGPAFVIPERTQFVAPQQQYLPADPRRPLTPNNFDEGDVSVQGLPSVEPQPIFEVSPINGQQFTGPSINADIGRLNPSLQQAQYQQQLERARQFARQREFESTRARNPNNGLPNQQSPRQFASQTTTTTTARPGFRTTQAETTTEALDLNEGETSEPKDRKDKVAVEVTKQNLQEYPPEIFLNPLAQLKLQPQFAPLQQFGQLRAPLFYQPAQLQDGRSPGFDGPAHLSALPSVLAQRELLAQQAQNQGQGFAQSPIIVQQEPAFIQDPVNQYRPIPRVQPVLPIQPVDPAENEEPDQNDERDVEPLEKQPKQGQNFPKIQAQKVILQRQQINQIQADQFQQPQFQFQPQAQLQLQPQVAQPNQFPQPQVQYQPQSQFQIQPQLAQPNQFPQPQLQFQPQTVQPNQFPQPQLQFQPQPAQPNQFPQPQLQFQPQPAQPNQFPRPQFQPQPNQSLQPERPKDVEEIEPTDQQVIYQNYQPQFYQPQFQPNQYQTPEQPLFVAQPQQQIAYPNQDQFYQNQYPQQQYPSQQAPAQDGQPLQSGLDINQQGNDIEQTEEQETEQEEEGPRVTAVATAFGTRTQPRVFAQYGAPIPKVQENPRYQTTTESAAREEPQADDDAPAAQATAVSTGRRNARLRSRRVRPIFTLDRSGHLVLAQQQ